MVISMKRRFAIIFKVNNEKLFNEEFDSWCNIGNGLYKFYLDGNKRSTEKTIINQANKIFGWHKGLKITEVVDVIELA